MAQPGGIEEPITSAPVAPTPGGMPNDYQRSDATAVSAEEYAVMAKRAKAEKKKLAAAVDPRSITGPAYVPRPRPALPPPMTSASSDASSDAPARAPQRRAAIRTRPVPEYQPLPSLGDVGTARLSMMIGADGRVKDIDIQQPLQRNTAQLLSAVQSWRFKPATENGDPVAAPYSVEIKFKP
jgi:protein TonB